MIQIFLLIILNNNLFQFSHHRELNSMGLPLTTSMTAFIYLLSMSMTGKLFSFFPFVHVSAFELEHDRNEFIKRPNCCLFHSYSLLERFFISLYVLTALLYMVRLLCMFVYTYSHIFLLSTVHVDIGGEIYVRPSFSSLPV